MAWFSENDEGEFTDASRASFKVKQDQRAAVRAAGKARGRLSVTAKFRFFSIRGSRWTNARTGTKVVLQRRTPSGWKQVGAARVGAKGLVTVSAKAVRGRHVYRVVQKGTARTWSASATVRR